MRKRVEITFEEKDYNLIAFAAKAKGVKLSSYIKLATNAYLNKYTPKGITAELHREEFYPNDGNGVNNSD